VNDALEIPLYLNKEQEEDTHTTMLKPNGGSKMVCNKTVRMYLSGSGFKKGEGIKVGTIVAFRLARLQE